MAYERNHIRHRRRITGLAFVSKRPRPLCGRDEECQQQCTDHYHAHRDQGGSRAEITHHDWN